MSRAWKRVLPLMFAGIFSLSAQETTPAPESETAVKETNAPAISPELKTKVETALTAQKEWMIFQKGKGVSRLKIFGQQNYYGPKENDIFKVVKVDDKYYAQVKSGTIFEEHWENKDKFQNNFVSYNKFIANFDKQIETLKQNIDKQNKEYDKNESDIKQLEKTVKDINDDIASLKNRIQQKIKDKRTYDAEERQVSSLDNQLKVIKRKIHDREKDNKNLKKEIKKQDQEMEKQMVLRKKYPETSETAK